MVDGQERRVVVGKSKDDDVNVVKNGRLAGLPKRGEQTLGTKEA